MNDQIESKHHLFQGLARAISLVVKKICSLPAVGQLTTVEYFIPN